MKVRAAIADAARRLESVDGSPRLDAELLMAAALGAGHGEMMLERLDEEAPGAFEPLVRRRLAHEPLAYITGRRGFWTIELEVGPGALIPRADSETLIAAALDRFGPGGPAAILDLGTGPGTLLLAALDQWPAACGLGVDASPSALEYARSNAARLGLDGRAEFRLGDWTDGLEGRFDLILCNPPYIEAGAELMRSVSDWEPAEALFGGPNGLDAYRLLAARIGRLLAPAGLACVEIGAGQAAAVGRLFGAEGFAAASRTDLGGVERCLELTIDPA